MYKKKSDTEKIITSLSYSIPKNIVDKFMIIQTGVPEESTGEMVTLVKNKKENLEKIFEEQEKLVLQLLPAIEKGNEKEINEIIKKGEKNLEALGVVSTLTKKLIREIEHSSGAAKICGAGGIKKASGIVLAFHSYPDKIKKISKVFDFEFQKIILGEKGLREEKNE